jgi:hypothetical protein
MAGLVVMTSRVLLKGTCQLARLFSVSPQWHALGFVV